MRWHPFSMELLHGAASIMTLGSAPVLPGAHIHHSAQQLGIDKNVLCDNALVWVLLQESRGGPSAVVSRQSRIPGQRSRHTGDDGALNVLYRCCTSMCTRK